MDFWILKTHFATPIKPMNMDFYFTIYYSYVFEILGYNMINVLKAKNIMNKCNMISIYCVTDFS